VEQAKRCDNQNKTSHTFRENTFREMMKIIFKEYIRPSTAFIEVTHSAIYDTYYYYNLHKIKIITTSKVKQSKAIITQYKLFRIFHINFKTDYYINQY